jgi:hypothetical protein
MKQSALAMAIISLTIFASEAERQALYLSNTSSAAESVAAKSVETEHRLKKSISRIDQPRNYFTCPMCDSSHYLH